MIEKLILSRFRGFKKGVLKDIGKINLFVGPNNSGKTTILEALYWLAVCGRGCGMAPSDLTDEDGLPVRFDAFVPTKKDLLGFSPCPRIWKRHGKSGLWYKPPGSVSDDGIANYRIPHLNKDEPFKGFRLIPPQSEEIVDQERFEEEMPKTIGLFVLENPKGLDNILKHHLPDLYPDKFSSDEQMSKRFAFMWFPDFIHWEKGLGAWGIEGNTADSDRVLFFDFHATHRYFTKDFWRAIRDVDGWRGELTQAVGNVFNIDEFTAAIEPHPTLENVMNGAIEIKGKGTIPIDDFGDGTRHAFKVLAGLIVLADRCKDGKEGIFLWEDPELFMHPKSLRRLLKQVVEIIKDKPIQVFISTQNLYVMAYVAEMMETGICLEDDIRTYTLDLSNGVLDAKKFWGGALNDWLRSGFDPRLLDVSEDDRVLVWHLKTSDEGELLW